MQKKILNKILTKKATDRSELELSWLANRIRQNVILMISTAKSGHPGGPLGLADIYAVLFFSGIYSYKVDEPNWEKRDRFLLSNGHVCAVRYAAMAIAGFFPEEELTQFRKLGSKLQGHPSTKTFPAVENSSGSLGQGLSNAGGLGLGLKHQNSSAKIFVGMSDGECQEGMTWEAAMAIAHYNLQNIHPFIDCNNIQIDGLVEEVMSLGNLEKKFNSFGWLTKLADGHNIPEIIDTFKWSAQNEKKPKVILFKTTLGKDVSYMENQAKWHGTPPDEEKTSIAIKELEEIRIKIENQL